MSPHLLAKSLACVALVACATGSADPTATNATREASAARAAKPNILVLWGDDIGRSNISAYTMGMMGYRTPNIDRIATEA